MSADESDDDCYGPALPPHLANPVKVIGPQLPASITKSDLEAAAAQASSNPEPLPSEGNEESDEDDDDIGPYPPDDPRSLRVPKARLPGSKDSAPLKREEWMLIAPRNKTIAEVVGMEPRTRKFLARTPDEVEKPEEDEEEPDFMETAKAELVARCEQQRDEEMSEMLKQSGSKGKESLLSIHRKRKKEVDTGPKERRPFDRDQDLKVGGLSKEDRDKFIKKTGELGNRFKGGKKKFL